MGLGFLARPWILPPSKADIRIRGGSAALDIPTVLMLLQQIEIGDVDLSSFDFSKYFEYETHKGDTLRGIARNIYKDERAWVVIYVINYSNDRFRLLLEQAENPADLQLPEGLVITLVERRR